MPPTSLLSSGARPVWKALLNIIYPPRCVGCGARLEEVHAPLCHRCVLRLERVEAAEVQALLARLPEAALALDDGFALWRFDAGGIVQRVQHLLKYGNRPRYGLFLGYLLGDAFRQTLLPQPDLVLPIPLHRTRLLERGYNQSEMLARGLAASLHCEEATTLLIRDRPTRSQTRLTREQRWQNVFNAFCVPDPDAIADRRLLLADDVLTTGATLASAASVLKQAGAQSVHAATLAFAGR